MSLSAERKSQKAILNDNLSVVNPAYSDAEKMNFGKKDFSRLGGTAAIGYGKFLSDILYIGGEASLDLKASKKDKSEYDRYRNQVTLKTNGFAPTIALRTGQYFDLRDFMLYEKFGITYINGEFSSELTGKTNVHTKRLVPVIGIGLEKNILQNINIKCELDYAFGAKTTKSNLAGYAETGEKIENYSAKIQHKVRGYTIRLFAVYNFGKLNLFK